MWHCSIRAFPPTLISSFPLRSRLSGVTASSPLGATWVKDYQLRAVQKSFAGFKSFSAEVPRCGDGTGMYEQRPRGHLSRCISESFPLQKNEGRSTFKEGSQTHKWPPDGPIWVPRPPDKCTGGETGPRNRFPLLPGQKSSFGRLWIRRWRHFPAPLMFASPATAPL